MRNYWVCLFIGTFLTLRSMSDGYIGDPQQFQLVKAAERGDVLTVSRLLCAWVPVIANTDLSEPLEFDFTQCPEAEYAALRNHHDMLADLLKLCNHAYFDEFRRNPWSVVSLCPDVVSPYLVLVWSIVLKKNDIFKMMRSKVSPEERRKAFSFVLMFSID